MLLGAVSGRRAKTTRQQSTYWLISWETCLQSNHCCCYCYMFQDLA